PAADHDDRGADDYCPAASAVDDVNDSRGPASLTISPQAASASSTKRLIWPAKKKPTWPPEYHSMRGRSQCSQSRRACREVDMRSPMPAKRKRRSRAGLGSSTSGDTTRCTS